MSSADAKFLGWQPTPWGRPLALYNSTATGHPSYGSTVTRDGLRKFHLRIPSIPAIYRRQKSFVRHVMRIKKGKGMFPTVAVILAGIWLLGFVTSFTMSGFIHALIAVAIVAGLISLIWGRRAPGTRD